MLKFEAKEEISRNKVKDSTGGETKGCIGTDQIHIFIFRSNNGKRLLLRVLRPIGCNTTEMTTVACASVRPLRDEGSILRFQCYGNHNLAQLILNKDKTRVQ